MKESTFRERRRPATEKEDLLLQKIEEQAHTIESLTKRVEEYKVLVTNKDLKDAEKDYKDRLFKFIFGNPDNKRWTLSLTEYNEEKVMEKERQEGIREGARLKEAEVNERVAKDMIQEGGLPASLISKISKLSVDSVQTLAQSMGKVLP